MPFGGFYDKILLMNNKKFYENSGISAVYSYEKTDAAAILFSCLAALQHRGQWGCGAVINDNKKLSQIKGRGYVSSVLNSMRALKGSAAIGCCRYGHEDDGDEALQPVTVRYFKGSLAVAFNGSLKNGRLLREKLEDTGAIFQVGSDAETIAHLLARERTRTSCIEEAAANVSLMLEGGFSAIIMSPAKMIVMRDRNGCRPLCLGKKGETYIIASEDVALDAIDAHFVRDIRAGEVLTFSQKGMTSSGGNDAKPCLYEYIYFSRPDSRFDGVNVYDVRTEMGRLLAETCPASADLVVGVPGAGMEYALGFAEKSKLPLGDGLNRNHYMGRTADDCADVELKVRLKYNAVKAAVKGKRVVLVDDTLVHGITCRILTTMLRDAGAKEVHIRIGAPAFVQDCLYDNALPSKENLPVVKYGVEGLKELIGADSLAFLPFSAVSRLKSLKNFCAHCFDHTK